MKYTKNYDFGIGFGAVGAGAYKVSKVWRLGFHLFKNGSDLIFRICFFRSRRRTYYWQVSKELRQAAAQRSKQA